MNGELMLHFLVRIYFNVVCNSQELKRYNKRSKKLIRECLGVPPCLSPITMNDKAVAKAQNRKTPIPR